MDSAIITSTKNKPAGKPAFKHIQDSLISMIKKGKLSDGAKLPSESQLCEQFGVSRMTVRHAISKMAEKNQIYRVHGKGTFVSNSFSKINENSGIVGLIMPGVRSAAMFDEAHSPTHYLAVGAIESYLNNGENQYNIIICRNDNCNMLLDMNPEGVIVLYPKHVDINLLEKFAATDFPLVAVHCMFDVTNVTTVNVDVFKAGQIATEYLIGKGKKNILFIGNDIFIQAEKIHQSGYTQAMRDAGLKPAKCTIPTDEFHELDLTNFIPLIDQYDGIITTDDYKAAGIKKLLIQNGYNVPKDIEIVSYADIDYCIDPTLKVPTVFYSTIELVKLATKTLLGIKNNPNMKVEQINITPKLIIK
jgi:GntR family transcriptional regulator, arabinose operon transcriptional repressor